MNRTISPAPKASATRRLRQTIALVALVAAGGACDPANDGKSSKNAPLSIGSGAVPTVADEEINPRLLRRFQPVPARVEPTGPSKDVVDLGRWLYFEKRLSKSGELSCNSCHPLAEYGVDHRRFSVGVGGSVGGRNAPTVFNAAGHFTQFWDGRSLDVEAQAQEPILNPTEMAMPDASSVVAALASSPEYRERFGRAFPRATQPMTLENVGNAIGAFERGLSTPGRWDEFLRGRKDALSVTERKGLKTFLNSGCMVCHTGTEVGGSMFERVGIVEPWPNQLDTGREAITHAAGDRMMFKVPSLRNVEMTAPYFHDGSSATLEDAVRMMGKHQLGLELSDDEVSSISAWLRALTAPLPPADYIADPSKAG